MKVVSSFVVLRGVRLRAFHGVLPQEGRVGATFLVNMRVGCSMERAMSTDEVSDALNYATLYEVVRSEMAVPSRLLEHVAGRIARAVFRAFPTALSIDLEIIKENPPMGADCAGAGVEIHLINDKTE